MVGNEHYWSENALRKILDRVQDLCHENTIEAVAAGRSALEILQRRMVDPSPNLQALTLAIYATTLRADGKLEEALAVYENGLAITGLGKVGKSDIYFRMASCLVCLNRLSDGLESIEIALLLHPDQSASLATRGWIHMVSGDFPEALRDCLDVIGRADELPDTDLSLFSSIVNAAACLSYEASVEVDGSVLRKIQEAVRRFRAPIPKNGSNFYKAQRIRRMLSRAEALVLARKGNIKRAISMLRPIVAGLQDSFPDDGLDASVDLMCLLAKNDDLEEAADEARRAYAIAEQASVRPVLSAMNVLRNIAQQKTLSPMQAAEIRVRLRSRDQPAVTRRQQQVA